MDAKGIDVKFADNITIWNLRGNALPMDQLVPKLIRRIKNQNYSAVIIDPIYKVITGDENNASDMGKFCNYFDKICLDTGCSTIYCHHHSKGTQGQKKAQDRGSGSGVFARDPDAIIDLIQLDTTPDFILKNAATVNSTAWRVEGSLREFPNFKPVNCWFNYPIHEIDTKGVLSSTFVEGSRDANLSKSGKRKQTKETRKEELEDAFTAVCMGKKSCQIEELAEYMGLSERTVQARLQEFSDEYISKKKEVYKL